MRSGRLSPILKVYSMTCFSVIVDDYDWVDVVEGTRAGLANINYDIIYEKTLNSFRDQNYDGWWNGLYVAVLKKRGT